MILRARTTEDADVVRLVRQLRESAEPRAERVLTRAADQAAAHRSTTELAVLVHALEEAGLADAARLLARKAHARDRDRFENKLEKERRHHWPRVWTTAFWLPDPDHPGPVTRWVRRASSQGTPAGRPAHQDGPAVRPAAPPPSPERPVPVPAAVE
ncbi:hypothetical protein [Streptomyces tsukubensis]|uniref:hypothetical protein n=1 Tax=Streptomyces tsukubensis TaxID=83656 RepID=UPI0034506C77